MSLDLGQTYDLRGARPGADAFADGAVPGLLPAQRAEALWARAEEGRVQGIDAYFSSPNPQALVIFVADHVVLPQDVRKMDMTDKERAERIRETLGDACGVVELQQVSEDDAMKWVMREASDKGVTCSARMRRGSWWMR